MFSERRNVLEKQKEKREKEHECRAVQLKTKTLEKKEGGHVISDLFIYLLSCFPFFSCFVVVTVCLFVCFS